MGLLLEAVDVAGPWRWRWLLRDDETGKTLADHDVELDPASDEVAAFGNLYGHARSRSAPDRRVAEGTRIVRDAGAWGGRELLGESIGATIAQAAPVTVRVAVAPPAEAVLLWPLELAHVGGKPLAARADVTLVYDIAPETGSGYSVSGVGRRKDEVTETLRILAVFSQPTRASVLALRRERYALSRLIRRIVARECAVVELRVVQYGATRERLHAIADSGSGWDVLHLSGHGAGGVFLLEKPDGSPDPVSTVDLVELLRPTRRRAKVAVVSACESAADTTVETLRLVGLDAQADAVQAAAETGEEETRAPGLARALVRELDCAVVAMRYPVTDEFAIGFGDAFYEHLLVRDHPVDVAAARAVAKATGWQTSTGSAPAPGPEASAARPAVSLATPGVFGVQAAGLKLTVPRGKPRMNPADQRMAYFPAEPERFVGRTEAMARASAALAPGSNLTAVLLHGMAGAGKTACALELAYRHQDAFAAVAFWQAPTRDDEFGGALASLASALEAQLGDYGFTMLGHIATAAGLEAFLPRLRQVMRTSGVLLVLDNLETLLSPDGTWRDPRWGPLTAALTGHDGESRLILTSRTVPVGPGSVSPSRGMALPVHSLSLEEAAALARELPHLQALLHAEAGPVRVPADAEVRAADRERMRRVLRVVQGHPKLLELADAAAADRPGLDVQLAAAEAAADGERLEAFFRSGDSSLEPGQFLDSLRTWTAGALAVLPAAVRLMAEFLACLEDDDRQASIVADNWAGLWRRLARPGDPPEPGPLLDALAAAALVQRENEPEGAGDAGDAVIYRVHPGVTAAIAADVGPGVRDAVDAELAVFWRDVYGLAQQREGEGHSSLIVRAGLAAAPYLLRRRDWAGASFLLERAVTRDNSPGVVHAALPALRQAADLSGSLALSAVLGRALAAVDAAAGERQLRDVLRHAVADGDDRLAAATAHELAYLSCDAGRLGEALDLNRQSDEHTRRAGQDPWAQLGTRAQRLDILARMGAHEQVLAETAKLRAQMRAQPPRKPSGPDGDDLVDPWNIRESVLAAGQESARALGRWQKCLDLDVEILDSKRERGAGSYEITLTRLNDAWPLINLGRLAEAGHLLAACQQVFEDYGDVTSLARALATRSALEDKLGHPQAAVHFAQAALRSFYARPEPRDLTANHFNLASVLRNAGDDREAQRAQAGRSSDLPASPAHHVDNIVRVLAGEISRDGDARLPPEVPEMVKAAERTEGVRLGDLLAALEPDPSVVREAFAEILARATPDAAGKGAATVRS